MPKRTNDFQTLIHLIESQLAPERAVVTESKEFIDLKTGERVEVDIAIEMEIAGHLVVIGVECRGRGRTATVEWIREIIGKYDSLSVDKRIAVSQSGFTRQAEELAAKSRITTLTLAQAQRQDWSVLAQRLKTVSVRSHVQPHLASLTLKLYYPEGEQEPNLEGFDPSTAQWYRSDGTSEGSLRDVATRIATSEGMNMIARERVPANSSSEIKITVKSAEGTYVIDSDGIKRPLEEIVVAARCANEVAAIPLEQAQYGPAQVAYAVGDSFGNRLHFTFVERQGEAPTVAVKLSPPPTKKPTCRTRG